MLKNEKVAKKKNQADASIWILFIKRWIGYSNGARPIKLSWISYISEQCKCEKDKRRSIIKMFGVGRRKLNQILHTTAAVATVVIFWFVLFVSFSFFGDNCTLDNLTSDCYLFCKLNWPIVQVAYLTTVSSLHNTIWNNTTSISNKYIFVSFPYQLIIIAWSMPYCHCLVTGSLNLYFWCKAQNSGWHLREADTYRISQDAQMR